MIDAAPVAMFLTTFIALIAGYPVALTLGRGGLDIRSDRDCLRHL